MRSQLLAALARLLKRAGVTPADEPLAARGKILRQMAEDGITGEPHSPQNCPLSVWLRRETGLHVLVSPTRVVCLGPFFAGRREQVVFDLPVDVAAAVGAVDRREVPELTTDRTEAA